MFAEVIALRCAPTYIILLLREVVWMILEQFLNGCFLLLLLLSLWACGQRA
jgi:hypothetical protein